MTFHLGYGTNGFANHRLTDALTLIADLGYTSVALTLDHAHLDPFAPDAAEQTARVAARLDELGLRTVVETGARYLLDPRRKHHPTLLSDDPEPRVDFLRRALRIAADLGADAVSFWSGVRPAAVEPATARQRLRTRMEPVLEAAARLGVPLGLEPEPGMLVERLDDALRLRAELGAPDLLGITLDTGHCVAVEAESAADCIHRAAGLLVNVQLDDMLPGVHEHLPFGAGKLDLPATLAALADTGYTGVAAVELPRHSHAAPQTARDAFRALRAALPPSAAAHPWTAEAEETLRTQPDAIRYLFPAAGRKAGGGAAEADSAALSAGRPTAADRARGRLLAVFAETASAADLAACLSDLYHHGDAAERRGVLHALGDVGEQAAEAGTELVGDALRTNDTSLIAAALGPFAARRLDQHSWRHGVLKCLFTGIPLTAVTGLHRRQDAELRRMAAAYAEELRAAGRPVPADVRRLAEEVTA